MSNVHPRISNVQPGMSNVQGNENEKSWNVRIIVINLIKLFEYEPNENTKV
jgi:hypothetical protein